MRPILSLLLIATAWSADPVEEILALPRGTAFGCTRTDGTVRLLDDVSHFNTPTNPGLPSFESSNGGMLAVLNGVGVLEGVTAYRASYTTLTSGWPGVWTAKDHTTSGPYAFRLVLDGTEHDLAKVTWNARTELIDNLLPVTTLTAPNGLEVRLLVCAPVSADGRERPRAVI